MLRMIGNWTVENFLPVFKFSTCWKVSLPILHSHIATLFDTGAKFVHSK